MSNPYWWEAEKAEVANFFLQNGKKLQLQLYSMNDDADGVFVWNME